MLHNRRHLVKSAPPLSRLPRLDSPDERRELVSPCRRQATARLRREFLNSRHTDTDNKTREAEKRAKEAKQLNEYKKYIESLHVQYDRHSRNTRCQSAHPSAIDNKRLEQEISKRDLPERLSFFVPIRLPVQRPQYPLTDSTKTSLSLFHTVKTKSSTRPLGGNAEHRHYFIERDWSSERISLARFHKTTPELFRRSWVG